MTEMTQPEKSLLLFMEACAVDRGGLVQYVHLNEDDIQIANRWNESGFIRFGRVASESLPLPSGATHWCELSDEAWLLAHAERRARSARMNGARKWRTAAEARAA